MKNRMLPGFSLVEFMIAITVSLVILAALTSTLVANSRARTELDRANQQIENGRYAVSVLADDLNLAGYLSHFDLATASLTSPTVKPRPCTTDVNAGLYAALPVHIQGYDNVPADTGNASIADIVAIDQDGDAGTVDLDCIGATNVLADVIPKTDILVIRRASSCVLGADECLELAGAPYFQASLCAPELASVLTNPNPENFRDSFRLSTNTTATAAGLDRTVRDCATQAERRRYLVHIYYVANNDRAGDKIPTLKRAELGATGGAIAWQTVSLANGIENFQVEYGLDCGNAGACVQAPAIATNRDGSADFTTANPDLFNQAAPGTPFGDCAANNVAGAGCVENWLDVVSAKVSILARNPEPTTGYVNNKIYSLGLDASGKAQCARDLDNDQNCEAFNDGYRRHVYQSVIRMVNPATRREQ